MELKLSRLVLMYNAEMTLGRWPMARTKPATRFWARLLSAVLTIFLSHSALANLVLNGDFSDGLRWWAISGSNGSPTTSGGFVGLTVAEGTFVGLEQKVPTELSGQFDLSLDVFGQAKRIDVRWNEVNVWTGELLSLDVQHLAIHIPLAGREPSDLALYIFGAADSAWVGNISVEPTHINEPKSFLLVLTAMLALLISPRLLSINARTRGMRREGSRIDRDRSISM